MKLKVCGMRDPENIAAIAALGPDLMGFIFYDKSPRHACGLDPAAVRQLPETIERVGVFVNAPIEIIRKKTASYALDLIQLHGDETPEFCQTVRQIRPVIKAVSVLTADDIRRAEDLYPGAVDYLLFDTKTPMYGGSGEQFDWSVLDRYRGDVPFFLSGGIGESDADRLKALRWNQLFACDINSRFESEPGIKDTESLARFFRLMS